MLWTVVKSNLAVGPSAGLEGEDQQARGIEVKASEGPKVYPFLRRDPKLDKRTVPHTCDFGLQ